MHILFSEMASVETVAFNQTLCHLSFIEELLALVSKNLQRISQL